MARQGQGPLSAYSDPVRAAMHSLLKSAENLRADAAYWMEQAADFEGPAEDLPRKAAQRRELAAAAEAEAVRLTQAVTALAKAMGYKSESIPSGAQL